MANKLPQAPECKSNSAIIGRGMAIGAGIGVALGAGIGAALGNIVLGTGMGVALGTALGMLQAQCGIKHSGETQNAPPKK